MAAGFRLRLLMNFLPVVGDPCLATALLPGSPGKAAQVLPQSHLVQLADGVAGKFYINLSFFGDVRPFLAFLSEDVPAPDTNAE